MTADRAAKRAVRIRMAATGEKYTQARRAAGASEPPTVPPPPAPAADVFDLDPIGAFTDQGYNAILLAEDEARMLEQPLVEPEHLLLAASRYGNVHGLLLGEGIPAAAIHAAIVARDGRGGDLFRGRVPRSAASHGALLDAMSEAFERGSNTPSTEHLLLGLAGTPTVAAILGELGVLDPVALVNARYPGSRPALDREQVARRIDVARHREAPRPGPMPPIFERFSVESRAAIDDAVAVARSFRSPYVTPTHLLVGLLEVPRGALARLGAGHAATLDALRERAVGQLGGPMTATSIFSPPAREMVAEGALVVAHRLGGWEIAPGHLLLAVHESGDPEVLQACASVPACETIAAELEALLAGEERA